MKIVRKKRRKALKKIVQNMQDQVTILTQMDHKNVCRVFDTYITPNYIHMLLEYCDGKDLFETIHDDVEFSEQKAANIIYQIADGLKHLHEHDIVHRDVKPENILCQMTTDGLRLKLVSFGFAKNFRENDGCKTLCGTPEYVAPEILNKSTKYQEKVDCWSLGVLMYILLVGYFPFDYDHATESKAILFNKIRAGEVHYDRGWDSVSDEGLKLLKKLLRISPSKRASAADVLSDPWVNTNRTEPLKNSELRFFEKQMKFRRGINRLLSAIRFRDVLMAFSNEKEMNLIDKVVDTVDEEPDTYE